MSPQEFREIAESLNSAADEMERMGLPEDQIRQIRESAKIAERRAMENAA